MKHDPYKILGVSPVADEAEVKAAYHRLAKQYHPDIRLGDEGSARKFKEINAAYDSIKNTNHKREQSRSDMFGDNSNEFAFNGFNNWDDIFKKGKFYSHEDTPSGGKRQNVNSILEISFAESILGVQKQITREDGTKIKVAIPSGTHTGTKLRLRGQGVLGGDIYVEVFVTPDKKFRLEGRNVMADLPISLDEAILGGKVKVETLAGSVELMIPPNSSSGNKLRLKGRGVPGAGKQLAGDLLLVLQIMLPEEPDSELEQIIANWRSRNGSYTPKNR